MFEFLKRIFPKKGENYDDLDDMYKEMEDEDVVDDEIPELQTKPSENRFEGILPDILRKLRRKSTDIREVYDDDTDGYSDASDEADVSAGQPGLLSRINNLEGVPKYAFLGVVTVLMVGLAYTGMRFFRGDFKESERPHSPPIIMEGHIEEPAQTAQNPQPDQKMPDNPMQVASNTPKAGGGMENPFVEANSMMQPATAPTNNMMQPLSGEMRSIPASAKAMPVIPSVPRPDISANPPAGMPVPNDMNAQETVQGVITGSNPEENVAIMGDGTVVSVGETYHDGRIAYIGGDGITFDDGKKLTLKQ